VTTVSDPHPPAPRAGAGSVAQVLPDAVAAVSGAPAAALPLPEGLRAVVVLVVDGLGRELLDDHDDVAPRLASLPGAALDAPFPTTTATGLTSIGTGLPPGEHGIVGYSLVPPGHDRRLVALTWGWDRQDLDLDAREEVPPERLQPHVTVLDRARERGVDGVTVLRPEFRASGLTRAGLRGGRIVVAAGLDDTLSAALGAAGATGAGSRPTVVYAYHGDLDAIGHLTGPGSEPWRDELARIDSALARVGDALAGDVAVVVTADHGMVRISAAGFVELADQPSLLDGVRLLTGDSRSRQLHTEPDAADEVAAAWRAHAGPRASVRNRDEAIAAGWFGPRVEGRVRPTIGDVVVAARVPDVSWVHRDVDPFGGRLTGQHGGLTRQEVDVPALVLTRRNR
jgi:hypothetical protein